MIIEWWYIYLSLFMVNGNQNLNKNWLMFIFETCNFCLFVKTGKLFPKFLSVTHYYNTWILISTGLVLPGINNITSSLVYSGLLAHLFFNLLDDWHWQCVLYNWYLDWYLNQNMYIYYKETRFTIALSGIWRPHITLLQNF